VVYFQYHHPYGKNRPDWFDATWQKLVNIRLIFQTCHCEWARPLGWLSTRLGNEATELIWSYLLPGSDPSHSPPNFHGPCEQPTTTGKGKCVMRHNHYQLQRFVDKQQMRHCYTTLMSVFPSSINKTKVCHAWQFVRIKDSAFSTFEWFIKKSNLPTLLFQLFLIIN